MDERQFKHLLSRPIDQIESILVEFNMLNEEVFNFERFHVRDKWYELWNTAFGIFRDPKLKVLRMACLNTIRILSRDKVSVEMYDIKKEFETLLEVAELKVEQQEQLASQDANGDGESFHIDSETRDLMVMALKCICNMVFQSVECRKHCVKLNTVDAINKRLRSTRPRDSAIEQYDLKLLFLITAFEQTARNRMHIDLNGITYMTKWLDEKLNESQYDNEQLDSVSEALKVMFNITAHIEKSPNESEIQNLHLTGVLRQLLLKFHDIANDRYRSIVSNSINLLTNISANCLIELMGKCNEYEKQELAEANEEAIIATLVEPTEETIYEGRNLQAVDVILRYLKIILQEHGNAATSNDIISPVLTVLIKCARADRIMRHYIRSKILPPLRDVSQRPEVGNEMRNHLCRFLTLPSSTLSELSAELLFICCKENVARMIKYTGYGNAAGLFAKRGLMDCRSVENTEYSSDSEDSDTEEYKAAQPKINPVLGAAEEPKPNPLEGMTEEQKEHEAVQLANLIDQLHRTGIVQPCRIDEDGKPQPVDHILQLQEELPQQQLEQKNKT